MSPTSRSNPEADVPRFDAVCTILGGPNGSGKSSIYSAITPPGRFVNADVIARRIDPENPERASVAAGKQVLRDLDQLIAARHDFAYETTLSSHQSIELMRRAINANYEVGLAYVTLRSPELNVDRVAQRVSEGGHHIPEYVVRRRYDTSLARLVEAIRLAHGTMIFDNSELTGPALLVQIAMDVIEVSNLDEEQAFHGRIASVISEAIGVSKDAIFRSAKPGRP